MKEFSSLEQPNIDNTPEISDKTLENKKPDTNEIMQLAIEEAENIVIRPEDRNNDGKLLVYPEGPVSNLQNDLHWKIVRTDVFKKWFGDWQHYPEKASKIVDANHEPLITYHCTRTEDLEGIKFDKKKNANGMLGKGTYFSPYLKNSRQYGYTTFFCFLNIKVHVKIWAVKIEDNNIVRNPRTFIQMLKTLPFSIIQPRGVGTVMPIKNGTYSNAENYYEISVPNPEDIMILPSPIITMPVDENILPLKPGHEFLGKE